MDEELNSLSNDSECDMTAEEYVDFDVETSSSLPAINSDMVNWRVNWVKNCGTEYLRQECVDLNEVVSDNDNVNSKDVKVVEIDICGGLTILERFTRFYFYKQPSC